MTASPPSRRLVIQALFFLPAAAGCSTSPPPKLYTLAPRPAAPAGRSAAAVSGSTAAASGASRSGAIVSVRPVELPKYLDRPQIVRYRSTYEMNASEFERWGEGLSDMVTRVLVENLSDRLPRSQVFAASGPLNLPGADVTIDVNIQKFDADASGTVVLTAQWVVHNGSGKKPSDQLRSQELRVEPTSADTPGQVAAMSDALGQLADQIAARVAN
jgi:hypothetical protein